MLSPDDIFRFYAHFIHTTAAMADEAFIDFKLFRYDPSMAGAVIFFILFLVVSVLHLYQMVRTKTWILVPFVIGGFCKSMLH